MKKIAIITIQDNFNLGNRLQNYAMQEILKEKKLSVFSLKNTPKLNKKKGFIYEKTFIFFKYLKNKLRKKSMREKNFTEFNKLIKFGEHISYRNAKKIDQKYDYFVFGSDQIWNPYANPNGEYVVFGGFTSKNKKIAISPSIAVKEIDNKQLDLMKKYLYDFSYLSCREEDGSELIEKITKNKCETLVDPTLVISKEKWIRIENRPTFLNTDNYILIYFLGEITDTYKNIIDNYKRELNCEIINIFDKDSIFYSCGPKEFVYLLHHCNYVLTDSFHGSVFSIIFRKQFRIFERKNASQNMSSRLTNLIKKFNLDEKIVISSSSYESININYDENLINNEINKLNKFIDDSLKQKNDN